MKAGIKNSTCYFEFDYNETSHKATLTVINKDGTKYGVTSTLTKKS